MLPSCLTNTPTKSGTAIASAVESHGVVLPVKLDPSGKPREVNLPIGDDIPAAAESGRLKETTLRVQFGERTANDKVELRLNGEVIDPQDEGAEDGWVTYRPRPGQYRTGDNGLSFQVAAGDPETTEEIVVRSVELSVKYRERT